MTNGVCTIYKNGTFTTVPCWYEETNAKGVSKRGFDVQNKANVMFSTDYGEIKTGDYIIKGAVSECTKEQLISNGALKVMSVSKLDFGYFPHYEVALR